MTHADLTYRLQIAAKPDFASPTVLTSYVTGVQFEYGMKQPYQQMAHASRMRVRLDNTGGDFNVDDNDSLAHDIKPGQWVKLDVQHDSTWHNLYIGVVKELIAPTTGHLRNGVRGDTQAELLVQDPHLALVRGNNPYTQVENEPRVDEVIERILDDAYFVTVEDDSDYFTLGTDTLGGSAKLMPTGWTPSNATHDLDTAKTTLPFYGGFDWRTEPPNPYQLIKQLMVTEGGGIFYWDGQEGRYRFHHRHFVQDALAGSLAATLDTSGASGDRVIGEHTERNMGDLTNSVVGYWTEKQVVNRVLVDLDVNRGDTPLELNQGTHEIEVYFTNPEPDATSFFGANQTVVAKRLNEAEDESGLDVTDWVPLTYTWYTDRVKIHYINNRQDLIYINQLLITGDALLTYGSEQVAAKDHDSIAAYGTYPMTIDVSQAPTATIAKGILNRELKRHADPKRRWQSITVPLQHADIADTCLGLAIGDAVRIIDPPTEHDGTYIIVGQAHNMNPKNGSHEVMYTLRPTLDETPFTLGTSVLGGDDVLVF